MQVPPIQSSKTSVTKKQYDKVGKLLLPKLKNELPSHLSYHNYNHILTVINATAYLLKKENVSEDDKWMVMTAALFHDAGFLRGYQNHEEMSCDIARETLPSYGYSEECIDSICQLIMATKLPQTPLDHYAEILCDADLFYLGTDHFFRNATGLFKELKEIGFIKTEEEWDEKQLNFLHQHRYFTKSAIAELEPKKKAFVKELEEKKK
jgi:predicted metal-dependent HD superfamily phosphohydrolase